MSLPRIRLLHALEGVALGAFVPFLVPLLSQRGLDPATIGLVLGLGALASLIAYPAWGMLADGPIGRPRTIGLAALMSAGGGTIFLVAGGDAALLGLAVAFVVVGDAALAPIADAITLQALGDDSAAYGRIRVWASIGWACSALGSSLLWTFIGPNAVPVAFVLALLAVATLAALLGGPVALHAARRTVRVGTARRRSPSRPIPDPQVDAPPSFPDVEPVVPPQGLLALLGRWRPVLASPVLVGFLAGLVVTGIGLNASYNFIGLRILDQGGGIILVGIAAALPALVESPVFANSRALAARLGLRRLYVSGALLSAFLTLLIALAPDAWMVVLLRGTDGISYGLRYTGMVLIIGALLPERMRAIGQSLAWFVAAGVAPILGGIMGGYVYGTLGGGSLFAFCALMMFLGAMTVRWVLRGERFGPPRVAHVGAEARA